MAGTGEPTANAEESERVESGPQQPTDPQIFYYIESYGRLVATSRQRHLLYLFYPSAGLIRETNSVKLYQMFLEKGNVENLDIVLHSTGGDLNEAYDLIKLCRRYTEDEVTVFVPMRAMSAATLIALGADKVILSEIGKLGPLDPQIPHPDPDKNNLMPVRSVTDIPEVLENGIASGDADVQLDIKGEAIIKPIAEQVDPYFLTEHDKTADLAREYGQKLLSQRDVSENYAERCLDYLIEYPTHSYSVDLHEIKSNQDLSQVINANSIKSLDEGQELEEYLVKMIDFFLHWDYKYLGRGELKMEPKMELIEPYDSHQQLLDEITPNAESDGENADADHGDGENRNAESDVSSESDSELGG